MVQEEQQSRPRTSGGGSDGEVIAEIYDAALSPTPWATMLDVLVRQFEVDSAAIVAIRPGRARPHDVIGRAGASTSITAFDAVREADVLHDAPEGQALVCNAKRSGLSLKDSSASCDVLGVNLAIGGEVKGIRLYRSSSRRISHAQVKDLQLLAPHLARAMHMVQRVSGLEQRLAFHEMALDRISVGLIIVAPDDRIAWQNQSAGKIAAQDDVIRIVDNKVRCIDRIDGDKLAFLIKSARENTTRTFAANFLCVERESDLSVMVIADPRHERKDDGPEPNVGVFLWNLAQRATLNPTVLKELFGLTNTEVRLVICLSEGRTVEEAAVQLGIKASTARVHLRSVYDKVGVHRHSELMRRILV